MPLYRIEWAQRGQLRELLRRHPLIHLAAPLLTTPQLTELAASLGRLEPEPRVKYRPAGASEILTIGNLRNEAGKIVASNPIGQGFHSDRSYQRHPPEFSVLYALAVPTRGGETHFSSLYRVYDDLDAATRAAWTAHEVEHEANSAYFDGHHDRRSIHRLVRTHPDTGRRLVFASPPYTRAVIGLPDAESRAVLERVAAALEPPDVVHRWQPHDLLIWDNRAVVHRATEYDRNELRHLWRLSVYVDH